MAHDAVRVLADFSLVVLVLYCAVERDRKRERVVIPMERRRRMERRVVMIMAWHGKRASERPLFFFFSKIVLHSFDCTGLSGKMGCEGTRVKDRHPFLITT